MNRIRLKKRRKEKDKRKNEKKEKKKKKSNLELNKNSLDKINKIKDIRYLRWYTCEDDNNKIYHIMYIICIHKVMKTIRLETVDI